MNDSEHEEKADLMIKAGLHFCRKYNNIVRYNPEFCDGCPHNNLKVRSR
ncbi:MAG: hypothetical protein PVJ38_06415 [Candidatus Bathyarchaeota archaeon]|jgi:hypothetical protein